MNLTNRQTVVPIGLEICRFFRCCPLLAVSLKQGLGAACDNKVIHMQLAPIVAPPLALTIFNDQLGGALGQATDRIGEGKCCGKIYQFVNAAELEGIRIAVGAQSDYCSRSWVISRSRAFGALGRQASQILSEKLSILRSFRLAGRAYHYS